VLLGDLLLDQLDDLRVDLEILEVDRRDAVLLAEEVGELVLLDRPDLDQRRADAGAVLLLLLLRLAELLDEIRFSRTSNSPSRPAAMRSLSPS
jgi:hypothetical protein